MKLVPLRGLKETIGFSISPMDHMVQLFVTGGDEGNVSRPHTFSSSSNSSLLMGGLLMR